MISYESLDRLPTGWTIKLTSAHPPLVKEHSLIITNLWRQDVINVTGATWAEVDEKFRNKLLNIFMGEEK